MGAAAWWGVCRQPWLGYDLAHWQGTAIPWDAARSLGIGWVIAKAWHGRSPLSSDDVQIATARAAEIEALGEYAWWLPDEDTDNQIGAWTAPRTTPAPALPLSIDVEQPNTRDRGGKLLGRLEYLIERVSDRLGERPIIYTGQWYWTGYLGDLDSQIAASCPLWLAAYPRKNASGTRYQDAVNEVCGGIAPVIPRPWAERGITPVAWQFDGDRGLVLPHGVDVDVNIADRPALLGLIRRGGETPMPSSGPPTLPQTPTSRSSQRLAAVREPIADLSLDSPATPLRAGEGEHTPSHLKDTDEE